MRSGPLSDKTAQDAVDISNISYGALNGAFWCMVGHSGAQSDKSSPETFETTTHKASRVHYTAATPPWPTFHVKH